MKAPLVSSLKKPGSSLYNKVLGLALSVLCLGGIGTGFALTQNALLSTAGDMNRARNLLTSASLYEQSFIARRDTSYADSARSYFTAFSAVLKPYHSETGVDTLLGEFADHQSLFQSITVALRERGLDENSGSEGALRKSVHTIEEIVKQTTMDKLQVIMLSMRRSEKDFFLRGKDKYIDKVQQETAKLVDQTQASALPDTLKHKIVQLAGNYLRDFTRATSHLKEVATLSDSLTARSAAIGRRITAIEQRAENRAATWKTVMIAAIMLSIITSVVLAMRISRSITRPVQKLHTAAEAVAEGNLETPIEIHSNDELGRLAQAFGVMVEKLRQSEEEKRRFLSTRIEELLGTMDKFSRGDLTVHLSADADDEVGKLYTGFNTAVASTRIAIQHIIDTITTTARASDQIATTTEQLKSNAAEQTGHTRQVAAAVEQMAAASAENAATAKRAAEIASQYRATAQEGAVVIQHTMNKISSIAAVVQTSVHTIDSLSTSSARISEIIEVIDGIADQTNLLALNAAIEAARAGEHGRGFSVVADEVGRLAVRTAEATKAIATMIRAIQTEATRAVREMKSGESEVQEGLALADKASTALTKIMATSDETMQIVADITTSSEEQSRATADIADSVDYINTTTLHTATAISGIVHSAVELHELTDSLQNLVREFTIWTTEKPQQRHIRHNTHREKAGMAEHLAIPQSHALPNSIASR